MRLSEIRIFFSVAVLLLQRGKHQYVLSSPSREQPTALEASDSHLLWSVTVPVPCSSFAERFVREASYRGGLIADKNDTSGLKLLLQPEPEAALRVGSWLPGETVRCGV